MFKVPFITPHDVVVSEHPLASLVGAKVLNSGGNAVDAAVATSFALSVLQPQLSGLGGDFFALIYNSSSGRIYFINGSGYSPRRLTPEFMRSLGLSEVPIYSPYSITVPGMVDALYNMWSRFGSIEWSELIKPSIKLAEDGFPQYPSLVKAIQENYELLIHDEGSKATYLSNELGLGKLIRFPNLAKALKLIADDYRVFYEGDIAEALVNYIASKRGVMELDDLRDYRSYWGDPIKDTYRDYDVFECPLNTQGVTTLHILKLLNEVNLSNIGILSAQRIELFLRCFKAAYYIRDKYVGDPRYVSKDLLGNEVINELFSSFKELPKTSVSRGGLGDTTYYAIMDKYGNVVSGIQSIFYAFGCGITEPKYGITLNCRASSFNLREGDVNYLQPRKLPIHTLSCVMMFKGGDLRFVLGTSGGHYRPQIHAELITNLVDYGLDPQSSIELPRFIWDLSNDELVIEDGFNVSELYGIKFRVVRYPSRLGVSAVLGVNEGIKIGAADIRGDGLGIGIGFP